MSIGITPEHLKWARKLVEATQRNNGLAPVDTERFWHEQEIAIKAPFSPEIPQVPLGMLMSDECLFAELDVPEDWYRWQHDLPWRRALCKVYNDKAEALVGRRLLPESVPDGARQYPAPKGLHDLFEAKNVWHNESFWLMQSAHSEDELAALLDRVDERLNGDLKTFLLPPGWDEAKAKLLPQGIKPPLYRHQRGPVTFATSIFGAEDLIYLILDNQDLAARLRDTILRAMLAIGRVLDEEAGYTVESAPRGFSFADDNCALLTAEMYEFFGAPVLQAVFERYAPEENDRRFQHSDSDMGHLLPILGRLKLNATNFGPKVMVDEIRVHLPQAIIYGELAPYTLMRNEAENLVAEFLRDFEMARQTRGLVFATAGSINNGSRLTSMRLLMAAIQEYGRYA